MKRVVLILVCSIIIIVFIAFNYLLWERENNIRSNENLLNQNASKSASIDAKDKEISSLNETNKQLLKNIEGLEADKKALADNSSATQQDEQKLITQLGQEKDLIYALKQQVDFKALEDIIKKWADSIDKGQYDVAFQLQDEQLLFQGQKLAQYDFSNYFKKNLKSIKVKSVKIINDDPSENKKDELIFKATFDVRKLNNDAPGLFAEGLNDKLFTIIYDKARNIWLISNIS